MSDTFDINEHNEVVRYTAGRRDNDTRNWRDATELELQQRDEIKNLEEENEELKAENEELKSFIQNEGLGGKWTNRNKVRSGK